MTVSGIILAGGNNTRMGTNKAGLRLGDNTFLDRTVEVLKGFCSEVILVANQPQDYSRLGVRVTSDILTGQGPLAGIHAGLSLAANFHSFVVACDMPFLSPQLGEYMVKKAGDLDVLIPRLGQYLQPLHGVYSRNCIQPIADYLAGGNRKITGFYDQVRVGYVEESEIAPIVPVEKVFFNVNSPGDLNTARKMYYATAGDIPVISLIAKKSNTGKTTLLEKLLVLLKRRGWKVATIKHHRGDFEIDIPGKDTWRHAQAGADTVVIVSPHKIASITKLEQEPSLEEVVAQIKGVDLIITEGYKTAACPKLEVFRSEVSNSLYSSPDELIAVASDIKLDVPVPCYDLNDAEGIVNLLEELFLQGKKPTTGK
ncbi:MAG TPA: molybdopterin-guanine dinucleotide biosynthesis protein B, partial [Bacillota bacterium]|nr:molybdopterin-guanine dinucleotide biosynthesis protein B [Bacillota bacterium]